jgi:folate-binding protein YgfZ
MTNTDLLFYYRALRTGAAVLPKPDAGVLRLVGADRVDFLQRMTTNNILALKPGGSCVTVLTSPTAKIVQVFTVLARPEELLLLPAAGETAPLERHLRSQIFFMDQVEVANIGADRLRLRLMGPGADGVLASLGLDFAGAPDGAWREAKGVLAVKQVLYDVPGYELVVAKDQEARVTPDLKTAGVVTLPDETAYSVLRVELGRPAAGRELVGEYNPLEAGLAWTCAENKGCYTGQEIIARQITYDKVTRTLAGLRSAELLAAGAAVTAEGREIGVVTSAAYSPALDAPLALAILKRPWHTAGMEVFVGNQTATVVALPVGVDAGHESRVIGDA